MIIIKRELNLYGMNNLLYTYDTTRELSLAILTSLTLSLPRVLSSKLSKNNEFHFAKLSKTNSTT